MACIAVGKTPFCRTCKDVLPRLVPHSLVLRWILYINWTMSLTQDSVFITSSSVFCVRRSCHFPLCMNSLEGWGIVTISPSGFRNPLPFLHKLTLLCYDCSQSAA